MGVIAEYNPFHNGHLYHLQQIKKEYQPDILIVVLSTYFTMRGNLSIIPLEKKVEATLSKADIVIALPVSLALNSADLFSFYAINELLKLKVNMLNCGSEHGNLTLLENAYLEYQEKEKLINQKLKTGTSYKKALALNLEPNDLLAFTYLKTIKENNYNLKLSLTKRLFSSHKETKPLDDTFTSSSAIRKDLNLFKSHTPSIMHNSTILDENKLFNYLKFIALNKETRTNLNFISEGLENLILKNTLISSNLEELIKLSTNKRYTSSRIKRGIINMLFNIKKFNYKTYDMVRVLGFNQKGKDYLNSLKQEVNIITNNKQGLHEILDNELKISKILDFVYQTNNLNIENKPFISNKKLPSN